jgi:predicted aconitase
MNLTDQERAMLDGQDGKARQKAMELLVRYGEALGAERLIATDNIAGVPGSSNPFLQKYYHQHGGGSYEAIFSFFDLDSDELVDVPKAAAHTCHLQGGYDPDNWQILGATPENFKISQESEAFIADRGVQILKTCTPYLAGNVPAMGDHCAWMESSAVVYCNSVIGARTNTEGRESTSAAMLTGKIPDWGFHRDENRFGSHLIEVDFPIESVMDWGMLGYFVGDAVQERVPVLAGRFAGADLIRHKHFGAAAASSGGVEMYHIVGITPEAGDLAAAFGGRKPVQVIRYGLAERRRTYDNLNSKATDSQVDYVMLGCPHYSIDQIRDACRMLEGKRVSANCKLWIFTSRAVKALADVQGLSKQLRDAGAVLLTDTCSSISQAVPPGTKVAALDSAKQTHYLPAIMNIQAWFGSTQDCIHAAVTGRWNGAPP